MKQCRQILTTLIWFGSLSLNLAVAQNTKTKEFYALFREIEFDVLHVYSLFRHPDPFPETSTYPFKGIKVDTSFYGLLAGMLTPKDSEIRYSVFYATNRFYLTNTREALLIREFHDGGSEHDIHYLIYDHIQDTLIRGLKLSYAASYEGSAAAMESWILDVNQDGQKDILTRSWSQSYVGSDAIEISHDSTIISIWSQNELISTGVGDTLLKNKLAEDFPYYQKNVLSYDTKQILADYLIKTLHLPAKNDEPGHWCIVAGSDQDLPSAKYEIERAKKIIGINHKYGLDFRYFQINKKNDRYYTIIPRFDTKNEAEIALIEIQKKFNKTAYVIHSANWCKESEYQKGGYYECIQESR